MTEKLMNFFGINRAVLALSVARLADALGNSLLFIIIPLYIAKLPKDYFHFPLPIMVGILISIYGFVVAFLQPIMGALSDHLGRRKILIQFGLGMIALCTLAFTLATKYLDLLFLRTLQGVAVAITIPAAMSLMAAITKKETRGGAMGVYSTFRMMGFVAGPLLGGFILDHFGFNAAFYTGSGFILLAMLLVQIWVDDVRIIFKDNKRPKTKIIDKELLSPGILSAGAATFLMASAFSMVTTLENEFNSKLGISAFGFGFAFSMLMVGRLLLQVPLGRLSDFIGRKPLIIGGLILMAPATILLGDVASLTQFVLVRLGQGVAAAAIAAPAFAIAADLSVKGAEGRQMSVITMGFGLGIATGPLIAGLLAVIFFDLPFLAVGILNLVGAGVVYYFMPETVQGEKVIFKK
ncbi:MAG: MFS transporter [Ignavibacteriaceae bacterium]